MYMDVFTYAPTDYFGSNMYIISSGKEAAVIDPSVSFSRAARLLSDRGLSLKYIFVTHPHFDHIFEIDSWVDANPDAKVLVGVDDSPMLADAYLNCYKIFFGQNKGYFGPFSTVGEGDAFYLSDERIGILKTPGHTRGSVTLVTDGRLFVGDVVFADGGVGRCDLPGGDYVSLQSSIAKISAFAPDTEVYSGHGRLFYVKELK